MEQKNGKEQQNSTTGLTADAGGMEIIYYTDPLCCWSWAMEPHWRRFRQELPPEIAVTYKMGGLLPSWGWFHDAANAIRKPVQMGPEWLHAKQVSGADIDDRLWIVDPPASSFPACIAVKSAEAQSPLLGAAYLRLVREAVMLRCRNVARTEILMELASELAKTYAVFDTQIFRADLRGRGADAFKKDWQETRYLGISRFPTLILKGPGRSPLLMCGYQPYASLKERWLKF